MRLSKEMIRHIAGVIASNLESKGMARHVKPKDAVALRIAELITEDLAAENRLEEDVRNVLASYESEISKGGLDYRRMFELTKQKLAKERGIVL